MSHYESMVCHVLAALHWRSLRAPAVMTLATMLGAAGCVSHPESTCERQSDCDRRGFCSGAGFCEAECKDTIDCPCGSFCAPGCNICVRDDLSGPATCFAFNRGLTVAEVLGVCRSDFGDAQEVAPMCRLDPVTPKSCELEAHVDSGSAASSGPDASPDATPDAGQAADQDAPVDDAAGAAAEDSLTPDEGGEG
jgi:hypothetical protein